MQLNNKFLFDRDFDVEKVRQQQAVLETEDTVETPPPPMYDEETLAMARAQAYEQGVKDGLQQAEHSQQQILMQLWDRAGHRLAGLVELEDARENKAITLAIRSAFHMIKKIWPRVQSAVGQQEMEAFIAASLAENNTESRIVLRVNDAQLDSIAAQLPRLKELQGYTGKIITLADDTVALGDCKIEWADGGAEKLSRHLMQQLEHVLDRVVGHLSAPSFLSKASHDDDILQESSE